MDALRFNQSVTDLKMDLPKMTDFERLDLQHKINVSLIMNSKA